MCLTNPNPTSLLFTWFRNPPEGFSSYNGKYFFNLNLKGVYFKIFEKLRRDELLPLKCKLHEGRDIYLSGWLLYRWCFEECRYERDAWKICQTNEYWVVLTCITKLSFQGGFSPWETKIVVLCQSLSWMFLLTKVIFWKKLTNVESALQKSNI